MNGILRPQLVWIRVNWTRENVGGVLSPTNDTEPHPDWDDNAISTAAAVVIS